jgi:hypothetical protein
MLTQAIVREFLHYDPDTGLLTWRHRRRCWFKNDHFCNAWNTKHAGQPAFTAMSDGYHQGRIFDQGYQAHRVIFLWMMGRWPNEIDHINHDRADNRWRNLREVDPYEQNGNLSLPRNNSSGHAGVVRFRGKWQASIQVNGRTRHLGTYPIFEAAVAARKAAERRYGFHVNHGASRRAAS